MFLALCRAGRYAGRPEAWRWTYRMYRAKGQLEFANFVDRALAAYLDRPVLLIVDNASIHTIDQSPPCGEAGRPTLPMTCDGLLETV